MKTVLLMTMVLLIFVSSTASARSYILTNVRIQCVTQCDAVGSDAVFVTIPSSNKTSFTQLFKRGDIKSYPEIGVGTNGSATTTWFVVIGDRVNVFEKDLLDPNDLIKQITITTTNANGQPQVVTGINGTGKYNIFFTIRVI